MSNKSETNDDTHYKETAKTLLFSKEKHNFFYARHELMKMHNAFVLPRFNYCPTVWSDGPSSVMIGYRSYKGELRK